MSKPRAPAPPDPVATANAQGQMNRQAAFTQSRLNAVAQRTPFGNLDYTEEGTWSDGTPRLVARQTLSPAEQDALNLSNRAQSLYGQAGVTQLERLQGTLSTPFQPRYDSAEAATNALVERMRPMQDRERQALETRLVNQGIGLGSEAWTRAMDDFGRSVNDARLAAIMQGGNEQSRALQADLAVRNQPINETAALLTGQMVGTPQFMNTPQSSIAAPDYQGAVAQNYAGQMAGFNAQQQARASTMGAIAGMAGAGLGGWARGGFAFSDRRLKRDVTALGAWHNGLTIYAYRYLWDDEPRVGFMADEVAAIRPEAVAYTPAGFAMVNYDLATA